MQIGIGYSYFLCFGPFSFFSFFILSRFLFFFEALPRWFFMNYTTKCWRLLQEDTTYYLDSNSLRLSFRPSRRQFSPRPIILHSCTMLVRKIVLFWLYSDSSLASNPGYWGFLVACQCPDDNHHLVVYFWENLGCVVIHLTLLVATYAMIGWIQWATWLTRSFCC